MATELLLSPLFCCFNTADETQTLLCAKGHSKHCRIKSGPRAVGSPCEPLAGNCLKLPLTRALPLSPCCVCGPGTPLPSVNSSVKALQRWLNLNYFSFLFKQLVKSKRLWTALPHWKKDIFQFSLTWPFWCFSPPRRVSIQLAVVV